MDMEAAPSLHSLVEQDIYQHDDKLAVVYDSGKSKECVTYNQMWETSSEVVEALSRYSVEKEVVGLCLEQDKHIPAFILGVLRSRAAFYNFEPESEDFVAQVVQDIRVRILIVDKKFLIIMQQLIHRVSGKITSFAIPGCPHVVIVDLQLIDRNCHCSNLAYCITTSGTTGRPKVVQVPHCCIIPNITNIRNIYNLTSDDLVLLCSPLTFDPSIVELFTSLIVGACLLIVPHTVKVVPEILLEVIHKRNKVTVIQCTPALLRRFNPVTVRETILGPASSLRVLSLGGEKFPSCTEIEKLRARGNQTKFFNLYGITEVSCWAMAYQVTQFGSDDEVHLGYPLFDTEVTVCDESGQTLSEGVGRIFIGGKTRQCIIGSDEENSYDVTVTQWRDTGDYGRITKDGYIYYIGREDSQVKRYGKRMNMEELNQVVRELSFIRCCATQLMDNKLVVFIVTNHSRDDHSSMNDTNGGMTKEEGIKKIVIDKIRSHLPGHYVPDNIIKITNLPITKHGKTDQNELALILRKRQSLQNGIAEPADCLMRAWKNFLCVSSDPISDDSLFIQLGGDSLKAVQLVDKIELELNLKFPKLLDLLLNKPFKVISDYIETASLEETRTLDLSGTERLEPENVNVTLLRRTSNENKTEFNRTNNLKISDLEGQSLHVNNNEMPTLDKVASIDNNSDVIVKNNESKAPRVTVPDITNLKNLDDKVASVNSRPNSTIETNEVKTLKYFDNKNKTIYDNLLSSSLEDISNKDKSASTATKDELGSTSHKRSLVLSRSNVETKKRKLNSRKRKFYKFIQRGNRIYDLSEGQNILERLQAQVFSMPSHDLHSNLFSKLPHDLQGKRSMYNNKRMGQLKVSMRERWRYNTGKCVDASPLLAITRDVDGGVIFIGSHSHRFSAVSMATGSCIWEVTLGDRIESSACLSKCGNYVIVGCYDGNVYVLGSDTGDIFWQYQTGSEVKSSPTVDMATGLIYVGSHSQCLYALDTQAKKCAWKSNLRCGSVFSSPVVSYNPHQVYVGTLGGWLVAVSATSGVDAWRYNLEKPIFSSPSVSAYGVVVGCIDSYLYQFSYSGNLLWRFETQGPIFSSSAVWNMSEKSLSSETTANQILAKSNGGSSELVDGKGISKSICALNNSRKGGNIHISSSGSASNCSDNEHELKQSQASTSPQMAKHSSKAKESIVGISDSLDDKFKSFNDRIDNDPLADGCESLDGRCYCTECTCDSIYSRFESSDYDEKIIFGSHDTNMYCLTCNGSFVWKCETESQVYSTPFINTIQVKHLSSDNSVISETDNYTHIRATTNVKDDDECGQKRESSEILYSVLPDTDIDEATYTNKFIGDPNENKFNDTDEKEHHPVLRKTENDREGNFRKSKYVEGEEKFLEEGSDLLDFRVQPTLSNETVHHTELNGTKNYVQRYIRKLQCDKAVEKIHKEDFDSLGSKVKTFSNEEVDHTELHKIDNDDKRDFRKLQCVKMAEKIYKEDSDSLGSEVKMTFSSVDNPLIEANAATLRDPTLNVGSLESANATTLRDPTLNVGSLESANATTLRDPTLNVGSQDAANATTIRDPTLNVGSLESANATTLRDPTLNVGSLDVANATTLRDPTLNVGSLESANATTLRDPTLNVGSQDAANATTIRDPTLNVGSLESANTTTLRDPTLNVGSLESANATTLRDPTLNVGSLDVANATTLRDPTLNVGSLESANATTLRDPTLNVGSQDAANATTIRDPTLNVGSLDVVAVASTKGTLYLVGAKEGQVLGEMKMRNEIFSSPILYKNSLIIGCRDDNVYCFDIEAIIE